MTKRKPAGLDFGAFKDINTKPPENKIPKDEVSIMAEKEGFTSRQRVAKKIDGRKLRNSPRKTQLNMNVQESTKNRFWLLAKNTGLVRGDDLLIALMDNFEHDRPDIDNVC